MTYNNEFALNLLDKAEELLTGWADKQLTNDDKRERLHQAETLIRQAQTFVIDSEDINADNA